MVDERDFENNESPLFGRLISSEGFPPNLRNEVLKLSGPVIPVNATVTYSDGSTRVCELQADASGGAYIPPIVLIDLNELSKLAQLVENIPNRLKNYQKGE